MKRIQLHLAHQNRVVFCSPTIPTWVEEPETPGGGGRRRHWRWVWQAPPVGRHLATVTRPVGDALVTTQLLRTV